MVFEMKEFRGRIAGRFHAEFYFYLAVFLVSVFLASAPNDNPFLVVFAIVSTLFLLEMFGLMVKNSNRAKKVFVALDSKKIVVGDHKGKEEILWKDVSFVKVLGVREDKWLDAIFGLKPSHLI